MEINFYGVRGSIPAPGEETVQYGGNTSCVEVRSSNGTPYIVDAGTGIRKLGLQLAKEGKNLIELPYNVKGMDVNFGGLLTNIKQKFNSGKFSKENLCYSVQETVFAMLVEVSERAMAHCGKNELLLGGGVACNKRLQEMCRIMCEERNAEFFVPENQFLIDNAGMIAWLGILSYKGNGNKGVAIEKADIRPYERTDEVVVNWR